MPKVYIVTSGEYSDYKIEKVFLDENKAELYKDNMNKTSGYNDYIVEIHDTFDDNITDDNKQYVYTINYVPEESKIVIEHYALHPEVIQTSGVEIDIEPRYIDKDDTNAIDCFDKHGSFYLIRIVTPKKLTYNQIEKIVYDRYAEYKAKENNI